LAAGSAIDDQAIDRMMMGVNPDDLLLVRIVDEAKAVAGDLPADVAVGAADYKPGKIPVEL
jgi:hypothetical protein